MSIRNSNSNGRPTITAAARTEDGTRAEIPAKKSASQHSRGSPLNNVQVKVPFAHSPPTRDADVPGASTTKTSNASNREDVTAFSPELHSLNHSAGSPIKRLDTAAGELSHLTAENKGRSDGDKKLLPSHAPEEEGEPPLFSSSSAIIPPHNSSNASTEHKDVANRKLSPHSEKTKQGNGELRGKSTNNADGNGGSGSGATAPAMPALPPNEPAPDFIEFLDDPDDDGYGFRSLLEAITNPQLLLRIQYGIRTVAFVTLPLYTISLHPNTRFRLHFPQMLIAAVVSTSTHRPTIGEQIGLHSWTWRGIIFMLIWGSAIDAWGVAYHVGAWYGLLAAGIFAAGLVNNGMIRRFMYLYFFLYMLELRTQQYYFGTVLMSDAAWSAADYFIGTLTGVAANTIPFPSLVRDIVDMIMGKIFGGFGKLLFGMINYAWSPDPHAAAFFFDDQIPFITIEAVLVHMSALLWFTSWEPMEFPLRNPLRRVKLSLLRRIMALTYAAFSCGRTIAALRQQQADRLAMDQIRCQLYEAAHGNPVRAIAALPSNHPSRLSRGSESHAGKEEAASPRHEAKASIDALRANSYTYVKDFATMLMQVVTAVGSTESTPEQLVKKVPFDALREKEAIMRRNLRLEMLQVMKIQSDIVARQRTREQKAVDDRDEEDEEEDERAEAERDGVAAASLCVEKESMKGYVHAPYGGMSRSDVRRADARIILEHHAVIESYEVVLRVNEIFLHLLMSMIAGELLNFGEQMKEYKPTESLLRRGWRHYIVEAWDGFWNELWCRLTLARPTDYRTLKDAIRMTCAYLSATVLNIELWLPLNGLYFFGVTPLLALPVEEESVGLGICRIAGNTIGCALGYMAFHNATNMAQMIAMTLCFTFIQQICRYHPRYGQFFFYGSIITLAGLATATIFNELVVRLVTSSYTVMAYLLCCLFIFPNDCRKICANYRSKLTKVISETIDDVALTTRLAIEYNDDDDDDDDHSDGSCVPSRSNEPASYPRYNTDAMQMCSQLNVELTLAERLLSMCDKWAPFAASELVIRGMSQFPAGPNSLIMFAHERMVANLRLLVFGVQLLHRPRSTASSPSFAGLIRTSLADFLDDFADAVRLVGADYVQALQRSRSWSYPRHLSRVSQLRRLRVRLHTLMYECYVLMAKKVSKGTFGMTAADFDEMRRDAAGSGAGAASDASRKCGKPPQPGGDSAVPEDGALAHENLSFLPGVGGNAVDGVAAPPSPPVPPPENAKRIVSSSATPSERIEVSAGDDHTVHMPLADRYLVARRDEELTEEARTARSLPSRHNSHLARSTSEEPAILDDVGNRQQQQQQQHRSSPLQAFSSPAQGSFLSQPREPDLERSRSVATSCTDRRRTGIYVHRAHLQESAAEPTDAWPHAIGNAESEVKQILQETQKSEEAQQDAAKKPPVQRRATAGGSRGDATDVASPHLEFTPVVPTKESRHVSKLILFPDKGPETYIPLYRGPAFTFMEDELDMPEDTDFSAIAVILLSCESLMAEFTSLPGSLNALTNYDKQLQESSVATAFLDKWSARIVDYRKRINDRYHYPKPPPQKRRPMHAQEDPWEDWTF